MTADVEIRGTVALARLRESPLNPRKHYDADELRELAASLTSVGVLQPLLVRPVPATAAIVGGEWVGLKHFEIVAGHRRYRAAKLAHLKELPVTVRAMTDDQVRAAMPVENTQRVNLRPSEEAASFADLVATLGVEKAAEKVGKPESTVRERAALAALPAWFLAAVDAGLVPASTAVVVARVPGAESREKAAVCVAAGLDGPPAADWRDEWLDHTGEDGPVLRCDYTRVLGARGARALVRTHFSRELGKAPFSRKSLDLVPEAGSCEACPKRAGNDPDLKAEGVRADVCTDPDCFERKVEAYRKVELLKAKSKHGAEPADIDWPRHLSTPKGWCRLDMPVGDSDELNPDGEWSGEKAKQTVGALLATCGKAATPVSVAFHPLTGKATLLVKGKDARKTMERAGLMRRPEKERRVPLGGEEVSLRPAKGNGKAEDDAATIRYRVFLDLVKLGTVEFDAFADDAPAMLFDDVMAALDTAVRLTPTALSWAPVPSAPAPTVDTQGHPVLGDASAWADAFPSAPPVHEPGNLPLAKLDGLNPSDVQCLLACGFRTLADLGRECGGDLDRVEDVLGKFQGAFRPADVDRVAGAVRRYLDAGPKVEARTSAPPAPAPADGSPLLRDVPRFSPTVADALSREGVRTLADLDARRTPTKTRPHPTRYDAIRETCPLLSAGQVFAAGDALVDFEGGKTKPAESPAKGKGKKAKTKVA